MLNRFLVALAILALTAFLVAVGAVAFNPTLLTGPWYEFTIVQATIEPDGAVSLTYRDRLSYGAAVTWQDAPATGAAALDAVPDDSWSQRKGGFLRWPRGEGTHISRSITTPEKGPGRGTLLIHPGTYRLRAGEKMVYYRERRGDGTLQESVIEVLPE